MVRSILLLLLLLVLPLVNAGGLISDKYDKHFQDAIIFMPIGSDWKLLKAQCYQESRLNHLAVSPVGAFGVCQFMPNTSKDLKRNHPDLVDFWLPETSITAAAIYMNQQLRFWSSPRSENDRYKLALASYNAGAGNIHKAQKRCHMPTPYKSIIACLPLVTGDHSKETIDYVQKITEKWYVIILYN